MMSNTVTPALSAVSVFATAVQINVAGINNVVSIICLILTCLSILINVVFKIIDKVREANADGKITADEVKDIVKTGQEGVDKIVDVIETHIDNSQGD